MMKDIREVYDPDQSWGWGSYDPMLESMGYEIKVQVDDCDYQGDSRLLLKDGERYGILIFGWGSCSGCDALQACESIEEVGELRDELNDDIRWFNSKQEAVQFFKEHDWRGDWLYWSYNRDELRQYIIQSLGVLGVDEEEAESIAGEIVGEGE